MTKEGKLALRLNYSGAALEEAEENVARILADLVHFADGCPAAEVPTVLCKAYELSVAYDRYAKAKAEYTAFEKALSIMQED